MGKVRSDMPKQRKQRELLPENEVKGKILTLRIDKDRENYLERAKYNVEAGTGVAVTRSWILDQIIKFGMPKFEARYPNKNKTKGDS